jgi:hypothetical protein
MPTSTGGSSYRARLRVVARSFSSASKIRDFTTETGRMTDDPFSVRGNGTTSEVVLPYSRFSTTSLRPTGALYDGRGNEPDVPVDPAPTDTALARLR